MTTMNSSVRQSSLQIGEMPVQTGMIEPPEGIRLGKTLGQGACGLVRSANQRGFARQVAAKCVRKEKLNAVRQRLFMAEACVTAGLEHPHIIPVHCFERDAEGQLYLLMKEVHGQTWSACFDDPSIDLDHHLGIFLRLCDAIAFAHSRGIIHRDIKGDNVMVGAYHEVTVMDWGCAVALNGSTWPAIVPRVNSIAGVSGSPAYLAPEMARADTASIGPCSDIYLLGATLYELLVGRPPHRRDTVEETIATAKTGVITAPIEVDDPRLAVPPLLNDICVKALHADPDQRYATVEELATAIRDFRHHRETRVLIDRAAWHLKKVDRKQGDTDAHCRQALSSCEQALVLWPDSSRARELMLAILNANARHSLHSGHPGPALAHAREARRCAEEWGLTTNTHDLDELQEVAARAARSARGSTHTIQLHRWMIGIIACLLILGGAALVHRQVISLTTALQTSQAAIRTTHLATLISQHIAEAGLEDLNPFIGQILDADPTSGIAWVTLLGKTDRTLWVQADRQQHAILRQQAPLTTDDASLREVEVAFTLDALHEQQHSATGQIWLIAALACLVQLAATALLRQRPIRNLAKLTSANRPRPASAPPTPGKTALGKPPTRKRNKIR